MNRQNKPLMEKQAGRPGAGHEEMLCSKYPLVYSLLHRWDVPPQRREDLAQEVFAAAWDRLWQLEKPESMEAWLYKITYRKVLEFQKEQNRLRLVEAGLRQTQQEHHVSYREEHLWEMVMELAPPAPMILMLRFQHGFSLREIAEMLDMNYNTVKTITFRAVQQLKTRLQNIC